MRTLFWLGFWFIYFPLIRVLALFLFWHAKVDARERFEKRNKFEFLAHSFKEESIVADLCFEFSSEGEFQQVAPLIEDSLKAGKKIELVFFSPSVEKTIMKLAAAYPLQIRYFRYPFLRIFPFIRRRSFSHWITAKTLIMVRYDFFPEFLLWSMKEDHELKFLWVSFKKERSGNRRPSFWKKLFLKNSSGIVYATIPDFEEGKRMNLSGEVFDFRIEQIQRRMNRREEKFQEQFHQYQDLKALMANHRQAIIIGNAWPSDLFLLKDVPNDVFILVVPHILSHDVLNQFHENLKALGKEVFELSDLSKNLPEVSTILLNKKGILCELYSDFKHAYVGGGFEGSIHSVLEPLVAGSQHIACGPQHHRSTEYDLARQMERIVDINTPEQFLLWLNKNDKTIDHDKMDRLLNRYKSMREFVISC